jgi:hypothetical protein
MKTAIVFALILSLATVSNAAVFEVIPRGLGSHGHAGTPDDPLDIAESIEIGIAVNHNPHPTNPSYDGYLVSMFDLSLAVSGSGSMRIGTYDKAGNPIWQRDPYWDIFSIRDDGDVSNGIDQLAGVDAQGIVGPTDIVWDWFILGLSPGPVVLDLGLNNLSEYADYVAGVRESGSYIPMDGWAAATENDLAGLTIWVMPEPTTLALLSLGGLLAIHKRRKQK